MERGTTEDAKEADDAVDPDPPGTPDQSSTSLYQAGSITTAEEGFSTPAASDAGGSEHLTSSSGATAGGGRGSGFDPLGMGGHATPEEQSKAVAQAKQLVDAGLVAYTEKGNPAGAEKMVATAVRILRDAGVGGEPLVSAEAALGDLYHGVGRPEDALDHLKLANQVAEEAEAAGSPIRPVLAVKLANNLGAVLGKAGQFRQAADVARRLAETAAARYGAPSRWTTHARIQLAEALVAAGDEEAAVEGLQSAADGLLADGDRLAAAGSAEAAPAAAAMPNGGSGELEDSSVPGELRDEEGARPPAVAARHAAARLLVAAGEVLARGLHDIDAERAFRDADRAAEAAWGPGHLHAFFVRSQLASFLRTREGPEAKAEAVALHEQLLAITEAHHGSDARAALALETMAKVYMEGSRPTDAVEAAQRALDIMQKLMGRREPKLQTQWDILAQAKEQAGDSAGARDAKRKALELKKEEMRRRKLTAGGVGLPPSSARQQRRHPGAAR